MSADLNAWLDRFVAELEALAEKHPGMLDSDVRSLAKLILPALFLAGSIPVEVRSDGRLHLRVGSFDFDATRGTGSSSVTRIDGKQVRYPTEVTVHADGPGIVKVTLGLMPHRMSLMTDEEVEKESAERRDKIGEPYTTAYASPNAADPRSLCARCGSWIEQADDSHECVAR